MIRERREKLKMIQGFGVLATGRNELLLSEIEKSIDGQFFFFFRCLGKPVLDIEIQVEMSNKQLGIWV